MKTKLFTLLYAVIIAGMLGSCKEENKVKTNETEIDETLAIVANVQNTTEVTIIKTTGNIQVSNPTLKQGSYIKGSLKLDSQSNTINAVFKVDVKASQTENEKYKFVGPPILVKDNGLYALVFRYKNDGKLPDTDTNGNMDVAFSFTNMHNWKEKDSIRIMCINENDTDTFISLTPYFIDRLNHFKLAEVPSQILSEYNDEWNKKEGHEDIQIGIYSRFRIDKTPKIAKGDLIVKL